MVLLDTLNTYKQFNFDWGSVWNPNFKKIVYFINIPKLDELYLTCNFIWSHLQLKFLINSLFDSGKIEVIDHQPLGTREGLYFWDFWIFLFFVFIIITLLPFIIIFLVFSNILFFCIINYFSIFSIFFYIHCYNKGDKTLSIKKWGVYSCSSL